MQYYNPLFSSTSLFHFMFILTLFIIFFTTSTSGVLTLPPNVTIPALFGFGDSIIDAGMNNNIKSIIKSNHPPYGKDFMGGVATGRFSNGRIPTDFLAEELSIKQYLPAYFDATPQDILTGVTFASAASGLDPLTSQIASVIPLSQQLDYFKECIEKMKQLVGVDKANFIVSNSVYLVVAGSDDISNTYYGTPTRRFHYDIDSYTNLMNDYAASFIQDLYDVGARKIGIFSAPPTGCLPSQRTISGGITRECAETYNEACQMFNSKLSRRVDSLSTQLANSKLVFIDIYSAMTDLIQNADKYGFEESVKGCCATGLVEVTTLLCNKFDAVCSDNSKYLFWDSYHPTEKGYTLLVEKLVGKYIPSLL